MLSKEPDSLRLSTYLVKDAGGKMYFGPVWDFDRSAGTPFDDAHYSAPRAQEPREWASEDATHPLMWGFWARLFADPTAGFWPSRK